MLCTDFQRCLFLSIWQGNRGFNVRACAYQQYWVKKYKIYNIYIDRPKCLTSPLKETGDFYLSAWKRIAHEICIALSYNCKIPEQNKLTNCSFIFDFVTTENLYLFCLQDLLLLYGYLCSGWCRSASLRHYRSRGHQHNLHSGVCEYLHLHAYRCKIRRHTGILFLHTYPYIDANTQINSVLCVPGCTGGQGWQAHSDSGWSGRDVLLCSCHDSGPQIPGLFNQVFEVQSQTWPECPSTYETAQYIVM